MSHQSLPRTRGGVSLLTAPRTVSAPQTSADTAGRWRKRWHDTQSKCSLRFPFLLRKPAVAIAPWFCLVDQWLHTRWYSGWWVILEADSVARCAGVGSRRAGGGSPAGAWAAAALTMASAALSIEGGRRASSRRSRFLEVRGRQDHGRRLLHGDGFAARSGIDQASGSGSTSRSGSRGWGAASPRLPGARHERGAETSSSSSSVRTAKAPRKFTTRSAHNASIARVRRSST